MQLKIININRYILSLFLAFFLSFFSLFSQNDKRRSREAYVDSTRVDNSMVRASAKDLIDREATVVAKDTIANRDSLVAKNSVSAKDSTLLLNKSSLSSPTFSAARDSVVEVFGNNVRTIYYYGDVSVEYEQIKLKAEYMEYNINEQTIFARGRLDTTSGNWIGRPVMEQGGKKYSMDEVRYNLKTKKAKILNMATKEADGILQGQHIKMLADNSINMTKGKYTVCDLEEPHYYVSLTAAKVITKPSQKTVFGPAFPVIEGVPLPIGIPFGFIPKRPERATGILMPTFGEEAARGFYMRNAGMYFVFGNYFDLSITGSVYTLGSWNIDVNTRYKVNYRFNGNFAFNYSNDQVGEQGSTDFSQQRNFGLKWHHSQDSKARPGTSFSASVDFSSPSNNRYNSQNVTEALQNQTSSSISYSKNWGGKFMLSTNIRHNQNSRDSSYSFTLPSINFTVSRFFPFKREKRVGKEKFYEKISFGYETSLQNRIAFKSYEFAKPGFTDKFKSGMSHGFKIGLPSFTLFKYLNFSPNISYSQNWFFQKTDYFYNPTSNRVEHRLGQAFHYFGITHRYSGSISMNTRIYGTFNFGKYRKIQAIRHIISPSLSVYLSPELGTHFNGWRTLEYVDKNGINRTYDYNIYSYQTNSPPGKGKSATASISIGNNLEMKVRDLSDTTSNKGVKKIKLIDQFNIRTGYNFLADSLKMSNIGMNMSTSIFGKVGLSASATFDPYAINDKGRRINVFNIVAEGFKRPLRLTNANASLSYSISGDGAIKGNDGQKNSSSSQKGGPASYYQRIYHHPMTGEYIPEGWLFYTNPNVPWSLNLNYSFNYYNSYNYSNNRLVENNRITQTLNLSGSIKLSPKMSINATTGIDLMEMKLTTSQVNATYDLHCFNISVSWIPSGRWQSYSFRIAANAAALADILKFRKSNSYWDNR